MKKILGVGWELDLPSEKTASSPRRLHHRPHVHTSLKLTAAASQRHRPPRQSQSKGRAAAQRCILSPLFSYPASAQRPSFIKPPIPMPQLLHPQHASCGLFLHAPSRFRVRSRRHRQSSKSHTYALNPEHARLTRSGTGFRAHPNQKDGESWRLLRPPTDRDCGVAADSKQRAAPSNTAPREPSLHVAVAARFASRRGAPPSLARRLSCSFLELLIKIHARKNFHTVLLQGSQTIDGFHLTVCKINTAPKSGCSATNF